jgi:KDO2-lipid IV(A) lauroyltransferase
MCRVLASAAARDVIREAEMDRTTLAATLRARVRYDGLWWRKFAYLGCVYGPEWWKRYSPPAIAAIIYALVAPGRRAAVSNMERILGDGDPRRARVAALRMFAEFAHCMTETMEHYGPRPRPVRFDMPDRDAVAETLKKGRGAVVVTAHFGNWDIAAKVLRTYDRPINLVMAREVNATTHQYVHEARARSGVRIIYSDTSVFSSLNMIRALQRNELVAMQLDRPMGAGGTRLLPFFGAPAPFPSGPFVLARLSGVPLMPVFIPRLGTRHYAIRVGAPLAIPRERDPHVQRQVMGQVVQALEDIIREFPSQWFQFSPFWPEVSDSEIAQPADTDADLLEPVRANQR